MGEIFRFMGIGSTPAEKGVERIPILPTQPGQGVLVVRRRENFRPPRGGEPDIGRMNRRVG